MMNMRKLGLKESIGIIFREAIYNKMCLKGLIWKWLYFCNITE